MTMPKRLSFQLYSARKFGNWDMILAHLAACGYQEVEGFGGVYGSTEHGETDLIQFRDQLQKHKLSMPTGHFFPIETFENDKPRVLKVAKTLGLRDLYCPYILPDQHPKTGAGWKAWGKRLGEVGKWARDEGFGFGWHNHDFEFRKLKDGSMPHERIFEGDTNLDWECDIAWIAHAGEKPLKWIKDYADRITAVHIKDNAKKGQNLDQHGQCDIGRGTISNWPAIFAALRDSRCRAFIMEHDDPKDYKGFAKNSFDFVCAL
jgi:sugar phosphate isomerase/epimerase